MYCRNCYCKLEASAEVMRCMYCDRAFNSAQPKTYLQRPFPSRWRILFQVLGAAVVSIMAAFVVSFFQLASASGH
jgi:hypothetical protein